MHGSGRTDSGVHARAQKANFFSPSYSILEENYLQALNGLLPKDIRLHEAKNVDDSFDSRRNATSRIYRYFIQTEKAPLARDSRYVWYLKYKPNLQKLNDMAKTLRGEIDCASFASAGDKSLSTYRYIENAEFWYEGGLLVFEIEANAFLWKMVRSITGTLIQCEKRGMEKEDFIEILESKDRTKAGLTAPPCGLFLWDIKFDGIRRHV